ncbi:hypothetical protein BC826DRAFT_74877 [Russula brevipes]|nr:hypothetical protein BC826DRAFT_74877 [Russula brevipes]
MGPSDRDVVPWTARCLYLLCSCHSSLSHGPDYTPYIPTHIAIFFPTTIQPTRTAQTEKCKTRCTGVDKPSIDHGRCSPTVPRTRNAEHQPLRSASETTNHTHARCMRSRAILSRTQVHNFTTMQPMDWPAGYTGDTSTPSLGPIQYSNHWNWEEVEVGTLEVPEGSGRRKMCLPYFRGKVLATRLDDQPRLILGNRLSSTLRLPCRHCYSMGGHAEQPELDSCLDTVASCLCPRVSNADGFPSPRTVLRNSATFTDVARSWLRTRQYLWGCPPPHLGRSLNRTGSGPAHRKYVT